MKINAAAVGKRRYGLGERHAPTRGKVNPKGYIQREIKRRNGKGNDGKSDRRSGLAKTALNRATNYISNGPGKMQNPTIRGGFHAPNFGPKKGYNPAPSRPISKQPRPSSPGLPTGQSDAVVQPNIPTVKINQNGQLDLPFDEAFGLGLVDQQQMMNSDLLSLQQEQQAQQMQYQNSARDLGLQYEDLKRDTLNSDASRGMAFSSQYANNVSNNTRNFNNAQNDLNAANSLAQSQFDQQRMGIQNAMNDYVRQAVLQQVMSMADQAGELGYGQATPGQWLDPKNPKRFPVKTNNNRPKPKNTWSPGKIAANKQKSKHNDKPAPKKHDRKPMKLRKK